ncbi:glucarate dehydratase family protein [Streptomyces tauricus]|uniref:glucarate dehydratase family protein n=1 Tax=Streptomyces tauricus TaxID=68274 RepID=UPI002243AF70|nr:glucarate dehydratase family protein [Streptomyces tauricus]MCW8098902.1 glucarate dehydratase family protein [Streptomyces tauricus]
MAGNAARIADVTVTPVAFKDYPLLNTVGVHEPYALRTIIEMTTESGVTGIGETYGGTVHLERLRRAAEGLIGLDVWNLNDLVARTTRALGEDTSGGDGMSGMVTGSSAVDRVMSPFDVACLDIQGKLIGRPVSDLLGGAVRPSVPYSAYLFYKWAAHPGQPDDDWGAALDPAGLVDQARRMIDTYGFSSIKLKGGVFPPDEEIAAVRALREAFPDLPLRLDPNAAWSTDTSLHVARELDGALQYLEDPTEGIDGMAAVAAGTPTPLATNMCVVSFDDLAPAVARGSVGIVLSDHHFWGGLRRGLQLSAICDTFGLGLSMHSNSHLGISLAAMTHLAAATPRLTYACDTHTPWKQPDEDVVDTGVLRFTEGRVTVPTAPGLGVELDRDALARLHRQYLDCGLRDRDDTGYMRTVDPSFSTKTPRW